MTPKIDDTMIKRVAKGTATEAECARVNRAAASDPATRELLALYRALPDALQVADFDEARWLRIETRIMNAWRAESAPKRRVRRLSPVFAGVLALLLALAGGWFLVEADRSQNDSGLTMVVPPEPFDLGDPGPHGASTAVAVETREGSPYVAIHSLTRGRVQGGDEIVTEAGESVTLRVGERATLTVKSASALRFHEFKGRVTPYLAYGELDCRIRHDAADPFIILTPEARLIDIGTEFTVAIDPEEDEHSVTVTEGAVRVERQYSSAETRPGQQASWRAQAPGVRVRPTPAQPPAVVQPRTTTPDAPEREKVRPRRRPAVKPTPAQPPAVAKPERQVEVKVTRTSWQQTLESLPVPVRERIVRFYKTVEQQMGSGYTQRAILNLENFLENRHGPLREKAEFLIGECRYQLQDYAKAQADFLHYIQAYPDGTWAEMARFRFAELSQKKR